MKKITTFASALALALSAAGLAAANDDHGHGARSSWTDDAAPTGGEMDMMRMMMRMHSRMMDGGMMGAGRDGDMGMMDRDMMRMMMGPEVMGGAMMAAPTPEAGRSTMLARLKEFDADGDGKLSLVEFEALHAAMIRETTVDRFQYLDADGDGRITEAEMAAPAMRAEMRPGTPGARGMMEGDAPSGN